MDDGQKDREAEHNTLNLCSLCVSLSLHTHTSHYLPPPLSLSGYFPLSFSHPKIASINFDQRDVKPSKPASTAPKAKQASINFDQREV